MTDIHYLILAAVLVIAAIAFIIYKRSTKHETIQAESTTVPYGLINYEAAPNVDKDVADEKSDLIVVPDEPAPKKVRKARTPQTATKRTPRKAAPKKAK